MKIKCYAATVTQIAHSSSNGTVGKWSFFDPEMVPSGVQLRATLLAIAVGYP